MFYAHFVLAKKGPLAKIWLAAHWDKKLTKAHVFETNIEKSVDGILKPKVKMALRTSGHLLLGVVRIYSRKAKYLLQDCNEAFVKIKMAFRPGMVDLPEEHREAAMNAITLPEVFHDFDSAMPELNEVDIEAQFSLNQSRAEEITMREDYGSLNLVTHDDGFGDMGFDTDNPDIMREAIGSDAGLEQSNLLFHDGSSLELGGKGGMGPSSSGVVPQLVEGHERRMEVAPHTHMDDGFGGTIGDDFGHAGGLFEGDLFGDVTTGSGAGATPGASTQPQSLQAEIEAAAVGSAVPVANEPQDSDDDIADHDQYDAGHSPDHSWDGSPRPEAPAEPLDEAELMPPPSVPRAPTPAATPMEVDEAGTAEEAPAADDVQTERPADHDNTTLLQNDEESFALAPVDATVLKGITKSKRKRKLIVDEVKNITGEEMKNQLSNTTDIITTLDLAPPTRRLMHWKETGGVEKLFTLPARPIPSIILFKYYHRNMTLRSETEEEHAVPEVPRKALEVEPDVLTPRKSTRKRKHGEAEPAPLELEPPTPVPQEYEPSVDQPERGAQTPAYTPEHDECPGTPGGMLSSLGPPLTPSVLGPLTPGTLLQGGITPSSLQHGGLTPGGLTHGGMTPAGLQHGDQGSDLGLTPAGLHHGGLTPAGLHHGGLTPAGLHHGGLTPAGLHHGGLHPGALTPGLGLDGGLTPGGLQHGGFTPADLHHGGMTPGGLDHGGLTPAGLNHGGLTPAGLSHGMLQHGMDQLPMMPQLGGEVSSLLERSTTMSTAPPAHDLDHTVPMEPLPLQGLDSHPPYQSGMQMTNLGYDEHGGHSPHHDYDLPPSVEQHEQEEREAGETDEQFSERVLNRRAAQLFSLIKPKLIDVEASITFSELAPRHNNRKQVGQKFYSLLVLKKHQVLRLQQDVTYGPITITRGAQFESDAL